MRNYYVAKDKYDGVIYFSPDESTLSSYEQVPPNELASIIKQLTSTEPRTGVVDRRADSYPIFLDYGEITVNLDYPYMKLLPDNKGTARLEPLPNMSTYVDQVKAICFSVSSDAERDKEKEELETARKEKQMDDKDSKGFEINKEEAINDENSGRESNF